MGRAHATNSKLVCESGEPAIEGKQVDEGLDVEQFGEVEANELIEIVALLRQRLIHKNLEEVREIIISVETDPS